jgi:uncharacterized protein
LLGWAIGREKTGRENIPGAFYNRARNLLPFSHRDAVMKTFFRLSCAVALLLAAASSHALSVDCNKIANPDENTICSEVALAKLDNELANSYKLVNANLPMKSQSYLKASQDAWWASPDSPRSGTCKGDMACIKAKYVARAAYMGNPNFRYEGVYVGKGARLSVQSFAGGSLRVNLVPSTSTPAPAAAQLAFDESKGLRITDRVMDLPPPADNCSMRVEFTETGATVHNKEAKKKACDSVKALAGPYTRDYAAVPGK